MDVAKLFPEVRRILIDHFDVDESIITLDANLYDELDIDSIDAVDLMVHIKELTGQKIPPEQFKKVRTIRDVLNILAEM